MDLVIIARMELLKYIYIVLNKTFATFANAVKSIYLYTPWMMEYISCVVIKLNKISIKC